MTAPKLSIKIGIYLDDGLLASREAESWEIAEQNLDSLKRWYEDMQSKAEARAAERAEEEN